MAEPSQCTKSHAYSQDQYFGPNCIYIFIFSVQRLAESKLQLLSQVHQSETRSKRDQEQMNTLVKGMESQLAHLQSVVEQATADRDELELAVSLHKNESKAAREQIQTLIRENEEQDNRSQAHIRTLEAQHAKMIEQLKQVELDAQAHARMRTCTYAPHSRTCKHVCTHAEADGRACDRVGSGIFCTGGLVRIKAIDV